MISKKIKAQELIREQWNTLNNFRYAWPMDDNLRVLKVYVITERYW